MQGIGLLPSIVILIGLFCFLVLLTSGRSKPAPKPHPKRTVVGLLDHSTGRVRVGSKTVTPAQARKAGIQIVGYYDPPKPRKKSAFKI